MKSSKKKMLYVLSSIISQLPKLELYSLNFEAINATVNTMSTKYDAFDQRAIKLEDNLRDHIDII